MLIVSAGEIADEFKQWEGVLLDLVSPPDLDPYDAAAFFDRLTREKAQIRARLKALAEIQAKMLFLCSIYASTLEKQIAAQAATNNFIEDIYQVVNRYFTLRDHDVSIKLMKAGELIYSTSSEDLALALTAVRRAIKAAADHFFPPLRGAMLCSDGKDRTLGADQYLNRLHEYVHREFSQSTSKELLQAELESLSAFIRRVDSIASKGVHSEVTATEAKQGLIGLYLFLYNVIMKKSATRA